MEEKKHALDIGCGNISRTSDLFIENGFILEGINISKEMIELAKKRNKNVAFYHADIVNGYFLVMGPLFFVPV